VSNVADVGGLKIAYEVSGDSNSVLRLIFILSVNFVLKSTFASLNIVQRRCLTFENIILCRLLNSSARFQLFY